jgi:uncharacterized protein YjbI with pentapeptide repeats
MHARVSRSPAAPSRRSGEGQPTTDNRTPLWRELTAGTVSGVISGVVVGALFFAGQFVVDRDREVRENDREDARIERQEQAERERVLDGTRLENLRFVRALSSAGDADRPFRGLDLQDAELAGLSLRGADFTDADLSGVSFRGSDLSGASFGGADVAGADFTDAVMVGATFRYGTQETGEAGEAPYSLARADLTGSVFQNVRSWGDFTVDDSTFTGATFIEVDWTGASAFNARFDQVCLFGAQLPEENVAAFSLGACD